MDSRGEDVRSGYKEEKVADEERSRKVVQSGAKDENNRSVAQTSDTFMDDGPTNAQERSVVLAKDAEVTVHPYSVKSPSDKEDKYRQQRGTGYGDRDEVESKQGFVNMDEDGHTRTSEKNGMKVGHIKRSHSPERSEWHHRESDYNQGDLLEHENVGSTGNKVKELEKESNREYKDERSSKGNHSNWNDHSPKERWSRKRIFIGNCYSVTPEIVVRRFPNIRSITLKGKPRFYDFNLVPPNWGADVHAWMMVFTTRYPFLEELRLKRTTVSDESLEFLARLFTGFKVLSLTSCDGFNTNGLASIASYCRNLTELDIQESVIDEFGGSWLNCFPETFTSLESLNFANLNSEVNFDALERLVARCKSLKVLKINRHVTLEQLRRLLMRTPQLTELGSGSFSQDQMLRADAELENAFANCKNLHSLSGVWVVSSIYLPLLYPACPNLTSLNLSYAPLQSSELAKILVHCPLLRRLWLLDTVEDKGLEAVTSSCHMLEELRVFPADPFKQDLIPEGVGSGVTESGFVSVSEGGRNLHYVLYFCRQVTNAAVATVVRNYPNFTHFCLCIMNMCQPDYTTDEPMDDAFGSVVKTCTKSSKDFSFWPFNRPHF